MPEVTDSITGEVVPGAMETVNVDRTSSTFANRLTQCLYDEGMFVVGMMSDKEAHAKKVQRALHKCRADVSSGDYDPFWSDAFEEVQHDIRLGNECSLLLKPDEIASDLGIPGRWYYQIECHRKDSITGEMGVGRGGKAYLSPYATHNELVQTALGLYLGYWQHEGREGFWYKDRQVFGPHIDTMALWSVANMTQYRKHSD